MVGTARQTWMSRSAGVMTAPRGSRRSTLLGRGRVTRTRPARRCSQVDVGAVGSSASRGVKRGSDGSAASRAETLAGRRVVCSSSTWQVAQERPLVCGSAVRKKVAPALAGPVRLRVAAFGASSPAHAARETRDKVATAGAVLRIDSSSWAYSARCGARPGLRSPEYAGPRGAGIGRERQRGSGAGSFARRAAASRRLIGGALCGVLQGMRRFVYLLLLPLAALRCGSATSGGGTGGQGGGVTVGSSGSSNSGSGSSTSGGAGGAGGGMASSSSSASSASSASSGSSGGTGGGGGFGGSGDCHGDADCPGGVCVEVTPGGFRVCQTPPMKATVCSSPLDQCCAAQPCAGSEPCYAGPLVPLCSGAAMESYNQCAADQCAQDADCAQGQFCAQAGTLGVLIRACLPAGCKVDADCAATPGGVCAPVADPCCGFTVGLSCVYPQGGCRSNADCAPTQFCDVEGSGAYCVNGVPLCPQ